MVAWLLAATVAAPMVLDPITGTTFEADARRRLPSGRHLGSITDLWLVNWTSMQTNGAGLARFDPVRLGAHGRSWTQSTFRFNGLDITDPALPGQPLVTVPHRAWDRMTFESLWTGRPGIDWQLDVPKSARGQATLGTGAPLGGGTWIPEGFMDREPATIDGAPSERRALQRPLEADLGARTPLGRNGWLRGHVRYLNHERRYPVTLVGVPDAAEQTSVVVGGGERGEHTHWGVWALGETSSRSHAGAEFRFPIERTQRRRSQAFWAQGNLWHRPASNRHYRLALGAGARSDVRRPRSDAARVVDLEEQWLWLARPRWAGRLVRSKLGGRATARFGTATQYVRASIEGWQSHIRHTPAIVQGRTATTYRRGRDQSHSLTQYLPGQRSEQWLRSVRTELTARRQFGPIDGRAVLAVDHAAAGTPSGENLAHWSPAAGVALDWALDSGGEAYVLLRREPELLTREVSDFIDPESPSGYRYSWDDDGDLVPEAGEAGRLLARTGGRFHSVDPALRRPSSNHFAIGWRSARFGPFRFSLSGIARTLLNGYVVRYDASTAAQFERVSFHDPGGDGRGEPASAGAGGQPQLAYARRGAYGNERYVLTNRTDPTLYLGGELQLYSIDAEWWFANLGAIGYWSMGRGVYGNFADRNDSGIVDEASADPNHQINERGRFDNDRAFGINILAGIEPLQRLHAAVALKYRDGQPFTRIVVADGLPQGPTGIMATWRGAPRFTFQMTVDLRLSYRFDLEPVDLLTRLDVYNFFGSGTEVTEDVRTGSSFRAPLEMMPGRAAFLTLGVVWN